ncbi:unnamed protein product [Urochloa humidicola]
MDFPFLDSSHGARFAAKVRSLLGVPIVADSPGSGGSFWLLAAFSRSRLHLSEDSVGHLLQVILGGDAKLFVVVQVDDSIFKFSVSNKAVGLAVYNMRFFSCSQLKVFFHLWNPKGLSAAALSAISDQGPQFLWQEVKSRKSKKSYAEVTKSRPPNKQPPLMGANKTPINRAPRRQSVFSRLNLAGVPDANLQVSSPEQWRAKFADGSRPSKRPAFSATLQGRPSFQAEKGATVQNHSNGFGNPRGQYGSFDQNLITCIRCLSSSHPRISCNNNIRCFACGIFGHIRATCPTAPGGSPRHESSNTFGATKLPATGTGPQGSKPLFSGPAKHSALENTKARWVPVAKPSVVLSSSNERSSTATPRCCAKQPLTVDPGPSGPKIFASFTEFKHAVLDKGKKPAFPSSAQTNSATAREAPLQNQETAPPLEEILQSPTPSPGTPAAAEMAFQRADPAPFAPRGMQWLPVENRDVAVRVVMAPRPKRNENIAIVTFAPLPGNLINFPVIRDVVREFLVDIRGLDIQDIQHTHLGQALVVFSNVHDCDNLVDSGPLPFGDITLTFVKHNRGRNWRAVNFNRECTLMLLGFPIDYWEQEHIANAICSFGRVLSWESSRRKLTRVIVRARVTDLEKVPQWLIISEGEGF